ncbi:hypothetical protein BIT28_14450 [Photobacterium proteolyticum]|uniref:Uncharacterized protein n=1 Tax=Photobacterium proteolyticum TaxID=1903952 RepID=A0A1Q9H7I6_9GAMM|nr:hypothetical protein [Photobacterium proteolyticum]OLQ83779.1 hypothetical protein BIT28_14450 [Photobacterium proteolyticum]
MSDTYKIKKFERLSSLISKDATSSTDGTEELADKMSKYGLEISSLILSRTYIPIYHAHLFHSSYKNRLNGIEPFPLNVTFNSFVVKLCNFWGSKYPISPQTREHSEAINKWLGKGVNKSNLVPLMFVEFDHDRQEEQTDDGDNIQFCIIGREDLVKLNKNNLTKYYKYSESDASAFIKNIGMARKVGYKIRDIKIAIPKKVQEFNWLMIASNFDSNKKLVNSWINLELMEDNLRYYQESDKAPLEHAQNLMKYINFVDDDIAFWKEVTQDWLKKNKPQFSDFNSLGRFERERHTVNSIRHNAINYVFSWFTLDSELHDAIFSLVNRKIANTFPPLRSEAIRQIEERDYKY